MYTSIAMSCSGQNIFVSVDVDVDVDVELGTGIDNLLVFWVFWVSIWDSWNCVVGEIIY